MSADVRVDIENDEIVRSAKDDKIRFVSLGIIAKLTKDATVSSRISGVAGSDVLVTPGTPKPVHS
jgi:hypothetical protein